ncbi:hypothetical protein EUX98_g547 [Antrodiella citrinella]|uniref:N-end rule aminoacyl transferase C-terminal domain-containing protein n=1 Tax=Antrodiella citrinella TaxID=2447956 RepID=A0A4S4N3R3_9APHY|nr:hypothetical protein EUX98_g547 [Antrodiella citrinella]
MHLDSTVVPESDNAEDDTTEDAQEKLKGGSSKRPKGGKASQNAPAFVLEEAIHAAESSRLKDANAAHTFEVMLEPSSFTKEKFDLYQSYQREIHHEEEEKEPGSFQRFLIDSSLQNEDIPYSQSPPPGLPKQYGSYHQLYRLDGKLIAMGVIDILPACVSSVYFMYEKEWERLSMGKMSALREISLVNEIRAAGVPGMEYLYMGFYIHSCQKMRYKGEYAPSYLADPEDYTWHSLDRTCRPLLDKNRYGAFTHPEHSMAEAYTGPPHNPEIPASELEDVKRGDVVALKSPSDHKLIVKRIIALPGDTVKTLPPYPDQEVVIPEGRDEPFKSEDSNYFGPVPLALMDSKLAFIVYPPSRFGPLPTPTLPDQRAPRGPEWRSNAADYDRQENRRARVTVAAHPPNT